jgi:hypothetical protein
MDILKSFGNTTTGGVDSAGAVRAMALVTKASDALRTLPLEPTVVHRLDSIAHSLRSMNDQVLASSPMPPIQEKGAPHPSSSAAGTPQPRFDKHQWASALRTFVTPLKDVGLVFTQRAGDTNGEFKTGDDSDFSFRYLTHKDLEELVERVSALHKETARVFHESRVPVVTLSATERRDLGIEEDVLSPSIPWDDYLRAWTALSEWIMTRFIPKEERKSERKDREGEASGGNVFGFHLPTRSDTREWRSIAEFTLLLVCRTMTTHQIVLSLAARARDSPESVPPLFMLETVRFTQYMHYVMGVETLGGAGGDSILMQMMLAWMVFVDKDAVRSLKEKMGLDDGVDLSHIKTAGDRRVSSPATTGGTRVARLGKAIFGLMNKASSSELGSLLNFGKSLLIGTAVASVTAPFISAVAPGVLMQSPLVMMYITSRVNTGFLGMVAAKAGHLGSAWRRVTSFITAPFRNTGASSTKATPRRSVARSRATRHGTKSLANLVTRSIKRSKKTRRGKRTGGKTRARKGRRGRKGGGVRGGGRTAGHDDSEWEDPAFIASDEETMDAEESLVWEELTETVTSFPPPSPTPQEGLGPWGRKLVDSAVTMDTDRAAAHVVSLSFARRIEDDGAQTQTVLFDEDKKWTLKDALMHVANAYGHMDPMGSEGGGVSDLSVEVIEISPGHVYVDTLSGDESEGYSE